MRIGKQHSSLPLGKLASFRGKDGSYFWPGHCQHRMACAKCDFYMPKDSTAALLLEGRTHLLRLLQEIPLGEAEQAAVEDGVAA